MGWAGCARPLTLILLVKGGVLTPRVAATVGVGRSSSARRVILETSVSEIHAYPLRPKGYAEPLFHSQQSRKRILEHFAESDWLFRASELRASEARRPEARWPVRTRTDDTAKETGRVIASWREVDRWWEPGGGVDVIWRRIETSCGRQEVMSELAHAA